MKVIARGSLLYFIALFPFTVGSPFKLKESVIPPRGWTKRGTPPPDHDIVLRVGLLQPNFDILEAHLYEVSDPYHPRYGAHLSKEEVDALVAPNQDSVNAVNDWLGSHGIQNSDVTRSSAGDWVTITLPVSMVEKMLDTKYHIWKHDNGNTIVRTTSYSLPEHLHNHVDVIQPTTIFAQFKRMKSTIVWSDDDEAVTSVQDLAPIVNPVTGVSVDASCNTTITLTCIRQLYNAVGLAPSAVGNSIGITGYLEQFANFQDLQSFYADQNPAALNSTFEVISINGGLNNQTLSEAGAEANLDVQFAFGLSFPIPGTFYTTGGQPPFIPDIGTPNNTNEPYQEWLDFVLSQPTSPLVISTSYGDHEQTVPKSYALRVCKGLAQLGARGVSLTFSSGDFGVGDGDSDPTTQTCLTNDGTNTTRFQPLFPASCPYVTSVGGTVGVPEVAVNRFFSGGGFSDYFERPSYQNESVNAFLDTLPAGLYEGLYNPQCRPSEYDDITVNGTNEYWQGIPDVAAQGDRFRIFLAGVARSIGGTSASSPTFAGLVALLNGARLSQGLPSLGFLNPMLYSKGLTGFNDILIGKNPGCGTEGFNVTEGWDPVTGLGTPNVMELQDLLVSR